jgi:type I restriction enzyme S subunit
MSVPALRFKEFSGDWEVKKLEEITAYVDYRGKTPEKSESGIFLVTAKNIRLGYIDYEASKEYIPNETYEDVMRRGKPLIGDVLITTEAPCGNVASVDRDDVALAQRVIKFRGKRGVIQNYFLKFYLLSDFFQKSLLEKASGGTVKGIKGSVLHKMEVQYPSLPEQTKIANFLTAVDDKIAQLTQKGKLLTQYQKGVMQTIFSQELHFKDDDGQEFGEWEEMKASDIFISYSNKNHNGDLPILAATQEKGMIYREDTGLDIISSDESVRSYKIVEKGDFVISLRSFQGGIEYSNLYGICSPAYTVLKPKIRIVDEFFKAYLKKEDFIERLSATVVGIRDGKQISYSAFSTMTLSYPSIQEQTKIANFLTALDGKINHNLAQLNAVKQYKQGLLQQMFV